jgi:hypothetical protein
MSASSVLSMCVVVMPLLTSTAAETHRPLPERGLDLDERIVIRVPADPHVLVDTNDYSLDPALVARRVEVRISERQITAVCLDTGELACRHQRSFAKHRTITALEHARALRARRRDPGPLEVEIRRLSRYDALTEAAAASWGASDERRCCQLPAAGP